MLLALCWAFKNEDDQDELLSSMAPNKGEMDAQREFPKATLSPADGSEETARQNQCE